MTTEKTNTLEIVRQTDDKQAWWCLKNKKVCVLTDNEIYDILHQNEIPRTKTTLHQMKHMKTVQQNIDHLSNANYKTVSYETDYIEETYELNRTSDFISALARRTIPYN